MMLRLKQKKPPKEHRCWRLVANKCRKIKQNKQLFTDEFIDSIANCNKKYKNIYIKALPDTATSQQKRDLLQSYVEKLLLKEMMEESQTVGGDFNNKIVVKCSKEHSCLGIACDREIEKNIFSKFAAQNSKKLSKKDFEDVVTESANKCGVLDVLETMQLDTRAMLRMILRTKDPFLTFSCLDLKLKRSHEDMQNYFTNELKKRNKSTSENLVSDLILWMQGGCLPEIDAHDGGGYPNVSSSL